MKVEMRLRLNRRRRRKSKIETEVEIEGDRPFGPRVMWLSGVRSSGGFEKLGVRNEEWWCAASE